jgi:hypothetical protein
MKILNWIIALWGLWEFGDIALPLVVGFDVVQSFVWNHILVGLTLMFAGARAALTRDVRTARTMNRVAVVAGLWLIVATFLLRELTLSAGLLNDLIVGMIVVILGVWASFASMRVGE